LDSYQKARPSASSSEGRCSIIWPSQVPRKGPKSQAFPRGPGLCSSGRSEP
jgi:hypothetical protein